MQLRKSFLLVLLLIVPACSQKVSFSFEVLSPEAAIPSPTPVVDVVTPIIPSPTYVPETIPTLPPPAPGVVWPTDFSPVLYGGKIYDQTFFLLLGGVSNTEWLTPEMSFARYSGEATYSLHSLTQASKYFLWGKTPEYSPTCQIYTVGTEAGLDEAGFVAVVDGWNTSKREVTQISSDDEYYQQVVRDWLTATEGIKDPQIETLQVLRVDLEGTGADEVFISATYLDGSQHFTKDGDYSIVLMRKLWGDEMVTKLLVGDVYHSTDPEMTYPRTYSLANFIDLNQDGVLEVVVDIKQWEGFGAIVYQVNDQEVTQVLRTEC